MYNSNYIILQKSKQNMEPLPINGKNRIEHPYFQIVLLQWKYAIHKSAYLSKNCLNIREKIDKIPSDMWGHVCIKIKISVNLLVNHQVN